VINGVWGKYKAMSGIELSKITHTPGSAWYKAWVGKRPYLDDEDIKNERID
jgi:uncharacterized phage-associated protein